MSNPEGLSIGWTTMGQEPLFDADPFYDPAADPNQPWNLAPGLSDDLASEDDVHTWGLLGGSSDGGSSGLGVAS